MVLVDAAAAASAFGIKPKTVSEWAYRGHIHPVTQAGPGRAHRKLYDLEEIRRHAEKRANNVRSR